MRSKRIFFAVAATAGLLLAQTPAMADAKVDAGSKLFKAKCQACHGAAGAADTPMAKTLKIRPMSSPDVQKQTEAELTKIIEDGKGKMPAFKGKLTKDEVDQVVTYIKSLKK